MQVGRRWVRFRPLAALVANAEFGRVQHRHVNRSAGAEDIQRVLGLLGRVSHREHAGGSAREFQQRDGGVFDFARENRVPGDRLHLVDWAQKIQ
jgi:hypothetical protein